MKVYAINGSPRKNKNTATLLDQALQGVKAAHPNAEVERIDLYSLQFTGCKSCFACKLKNGASYGTCALHDDLHDVLEKVKAADGIIFGSPIYYNEITSGLHAFYERLFFPYLEYKPGYPNLVTNKLKTACMYTMNVTEEWMIKNGYPRNLKPFENYLENYFSKPVVLYSFNTYQFDDYSKYVCDAFKEEEKAEQRRTQFPIDCQKAFEIGKKLLEQ